MFTKKDFTIKGRFTGNRLAGHENEFLYHIEINGRWLSSQEFTSKAKADKYLSAVLKAYKGERK